MSKGLPGQGIRLLDHGVVGGLILLQFATYFYKNYALMGRARPRGGDKEKIWVYFKEERPKITKLTYDAYWWWYSILWGTAATAIHNIQQSFRFWPYNQEKIKPLSIEEDPLSYLGILVDLIQEWDRYTVDKRSILTGNLPFQGDDVNLSIKNGKIILNYKDKNKSNKVRLELDNSLADWDKIISVVRNK